MDVQVTLAEAVTILHPPITETQLRQIIRALRWKPAGVHPSTRPGRRTITYCWEDLAQLHQALRPWLELAQ